MIVLCLLSILIWIIGFFVLCKMQKSTDFNISYKLQLIHSILITSIGIVLITNPNEANNMYNYLIVFSFGYYLLKSIVQFYFIFHKIYPKIGYKPINIVSTFFVIDILHLCYIFNKEQFYEFIVTEMIFNIINILTCVVLLISENLCSDLTYVNYFAQFLLYFIKSNQLVYIGSKFICYFYLLFYFCNQIYFFAFYLKMMFDF